MGFIKRYLIGVNEDTSKWEILRVITTWIAIIILFSVAFQMVEIRLQVIEIQRIINEEDLAFVCKFIFPSLNGSSNNISDIAIQQGQSINISLFNTTPSFE